MCLEEEPIYEQDLGVGLIDVWNETLHLVTVQQAGYVRLEHKKLCECHHTKVKTLPVKNHNHMYFIKCKFKNTLLFTILGLLIYLDTICRSVNFIPETHCLYVHCHN